MHCSQIERFLEASQEIADELRLEVDEALDTKVICKCGNTIKVDSIVLGRCVHCHTSIQLVVG